MRGGARVLPGVRCFRGAAAVLGGGAAAVFGVRGGCLRNLSAALSLRSVRRRSAAGVLASVQLLGRGFLPRLFFLTAARKTGARRFLVWARGGGR